MTLMKTKTLSDVTQKGEKWDLHDSISLKGSMTNPANYYQLIRGKNILHIQQL